MGEKNKKPTKKKLKDGVKEGNVLKVVTIAKLVAVVGVLETVLATHETWTQALQEILRTPIGVLGSAIGNTGNASTSLAALIAVPLLTKALVMSLAAVGFAVLLSLLANVAQVGFVWAPGALCKADHIDPTKNIVQMVSPEQLLQVPLNLLKVAVIGSCFAYAVYRSLESVVHMADGTLEQAFEVALRLATYCYRSTLIALIVFAIIDWMLRRHFFMKQMMMDEEEVERENKEQYGEKHVRSHRKRMMHEMVMGGAERRRKPPNAVVTNPTHFAIGLRYVPSECPLPIVIERTRDQAALDLIREAKEAGIPIVRSIWLARTLYAVGKEDHVIPRITLKAVAAVYRAIIEVTMKEGVVREVLHVDERY